MTTTRPTIATYDSDGNYTHREMTEAEYADYLLITAEVVTAPVETPPVEDGE